jgi:uncharacterized protein (TIGR03437 family)
MPSRLAQLFCFFLVTAGIFRLAAAPTVSNVQNATTNIPQGLPNAQIAQGSLFVIKGSGLGPADIVIASPAFQTTTLSSTSVAVTAGGTTVNAPMYYTSASQIAALLPSSTPTGTVTLTVTYNGQTSAPAQFTVVQFGFGVLTLDSSGQGPAIVSFSNYSLVSAAIAGNCGPPLTLCGAANPGDTLFLWGTGLGPVSGNELSGSGLGQDMPNLPVTVWLGGVQAPVSYRGRSGCCIAEDQIAITVPNTVPAGCAVPLVVQINGRISNTTLLPVANGSRTCTGNNPAINVQQLATTTSFTVGALELDHLLPTADSSLVDRAKFDFIKVSGIPAVSQADLAVYLDNPPLGTCMTVVGPNTPSDAFFNSVTLAPLDAGSTFTVTGPKGSMTVTANTGDRPTISAAGTFLVPGNYTITGSGGKDVGAFTANIAIPVSPTLTSPAGPSGLTVSRSQGMPVSWNSNGATGHVELVLLSNFSPSVQATAVCEAPASAGRFTIPPYVLLALPPGNFTGFFFALGDFAGPATTAAFTANGLNVGIAQTFVDAAGFGGFVLQ